MMVDLGHAVLVRAEGRGAQKRTKVQAKEARVDLHLPLFPQYDASGGSRARAARHRRRRPEYAVRLPAACAVPPRPRHRTALEPQSPKDPPPSRSEATPKRERRTSSPAVRAEAVPEGSAASNRRAKSG